MIEQIIKEAIEQCDTGEYRVITLRQLLAEVGCIDDEADLIIRYVADHGFNYCVDPIIAIPSSSDVTSYPPKSGCYYGVDQLKSRLECLR